jgi:hypothetical protein
MKKLLVGLCFLIAAQAQTATVSFGNVVPINRLTLNDLGLVGGKQTVPDVFSATLTISGIGESAVNGFFKAEILRDDEVLFVITSNTFPLKDGNKTWTSSDLGKSDLKWPNDAGTKITFKGKAVGDFKPSGASLPDGKYVVRFSVYAGGSEIGGATLELGDIVNNFALTLGSPEDDGQIYNGTPTFRWTSGADLSKLTGLTLYVYEINGAESQSASIARNPILQTKDNELEGNTTSYSFPANNPRALEPGKSYYWTLKAKINVLGGKTTEVTADNINRFTYTSANSATFSEMQIDGLEEIMGNQYSKVMQSLTGYRLKSAKFMGIPVTSSTGSKIIESFGTAMKKAGAKVIINY